MELIKPIQTGTALLHDVQTTQPEFGQLAMWWLGQSGYIFKTASFTLYVDLYLSEHLTTKYAATEKPHIRITEAPLRGHEITDAALVFSSHKHSDHLDPSTIPALFAASPQARLVLPAALVDYAADTLKLPRERLIATQGDDTVVEGQLTVQVLPSAHPDFEYDEVNGYPFVGYVFEVDGVTFYHSGDTLIYDGLSERLERLKPDVVFLPINGTDARRDALHVPPNMSMYDAVDLAKAIGSPLLIPHHYDMFTFNTADVNEFTKYADSQGQPYQVLQCGEKFIFTK